MTSPTVYFLPLKALSKFPLGEMVITSNAARKISSQAVADGLRRHAACDWGELTPEDVESNEYALKHGERLFSAYGQGEERFWVITERDRSVTTVLMPEDY